MKKMTMDQVTVTIMLLSLFTLACCQQQQLENHVYLFDNGPPEDENPHYRSIMVESEDPASRYNTQYSPEPTEDSFIQKPTGNYFYGNSVNAPTEVKEEAKLEQIVESPLYAQYHKYKEALKRKQLVENPQQGSEFAQYHKYKEALKRKQLLENRQLGHELRKPTNPEELRLVESEQPEQRFEQQVKNAKELEYEDTSQVHQPSSSNLVHEEQGKSYANPIGHGYHNPLKLAQMKNSVYPSPRFTVEEFSPAADTTTEHQNAAQHLVQSSSKSDANADDFALKPTQAVILGNPRPNIHREGATGRFAQLNKHEKSVAAHTSPEKGDNQPGKEDQIKGATREQAVNIKVIEVGDDNEDVSKKSGDRKKDETNSENQTVSNEHQEILASRQFENQTESNGKEQKMFEKVDSENAKQAEQNEKEQKEILAREESKNDHEYDLTDNEEKEALFQEEQSKNKTSPEEHYFAAQEQAFAADEATLASKAAGFALHINATDKVNDRDSPSVKEEMNKDLKAGDNKETAATEKLKNKGFSDTGPNTDEDTSEGSSSNNKQTESEKSGESLTSPKESSQQTTNESSKELLKESPASKESSKETTKELSNESSNKPSETNSQESEKTSEYQTHSEEKSQESTKESPASESKTIGFEKSGDPLTASNEENSSTGNHDDQQVDMMAKLTNEEEDYMEGFPADSNSHVNGRKPAPTAEKATDVKASGKQHIVSDDEANQQDESRQQVGALGIAYQKGDTTGSSDEESGNKLQVEEDEQRQGSSPSSSIGHHHSSQTADDVVQDSEQYHHPTQEEEAMSEVENNMDSNPEHQLDPTVEEAPVDAKNTISSYINAESEKTKTIQTDDKDDLKTTNSKEDGNEMESSQSLLNLSKEEDDSSKQSNTSRLASASEHGDVHSFKDSEKDRHAEEETIYKDILNNNNNKGNNSETEENSKTNTDTKSDDNKSTTPGVGDSFNDNDNNTFSTTDVDEATMYNNTASETSSMENKTLNAGNNALLEENAQNKGFVVHSMGFHAARKSEPESTGTTTQTSQSGSLGKGFSSTSPDSGEATIDVNDKDAANQTEVDDPSSSSTSSSSSITQGKGFTLPSKPTKGFKIPIVNNNQQHSQSNNSIQNNGEEEKGLKTSDQRNATAKPIADDDQDQRLNESTSKTNSTLSSDAQQGFVVSPKQTNKIQEEYESESTINDNEETVGSDHQKGLIPTTLIEDEEAIDRPTADNTTTPETESHNSEPIDVKGKSRSKGFHNEAQNASPSVKEEMNKDLKAGDNKETAGTEELKINGFNYVNDTGPSIDEDTSKEASKESPQTTSKEKSEVAPSVVDDKDEDKPHGLVTASKVEASVLPYADTNAGSEMYPQQEQPELTNPATPDYQGVQEQAVAKEGVSRKSEENQHHGPVMMEEPAVEMERDGDESNAKDGTPYQEDEAPIHEEEAPKTGEEPQNDGEGALNLKGGNDGAEGRDLQIGKDNLTQTVDSAVNETAVDIVDDKPPSDNATITTSLAEEKIADELEAEARIAEKKLIDDEEEKKKEQETENMQVTSVRNETATEQNEIKAEQDEQQKLIDDSKELIDNNGDHNNNTMGGETSSSIEHDSQRIESDMTNSKSSDKQEEVELHLQNEAAKDDAEGAINAENEAKAVDDQKVNDTNSTVSSFENDTQTEGESQIDAPVEEGVKKSPPGSLNTLERISALTEWLKKASTLLKKEDIDFKRRKRTKVQPKATKSVAKHSGRRKQPVVVTMIQQKSGKPSTAANQRLHKTTNVPLKKKADTIKRHFISRRKNLNLNKNHKSGSSSNKRHNVSVDKTPRKYARVLNDFYRKLNSQ